jgi:hypothetical protein
MNTGQFILKGAFLFAVWTGQIYRPTRDLDLLGYGDSSVEALTHLFKDVCTTQVDPDGLVFEPDTIQVTEIREEQVYPGQRVRLVAMLGKARIPLQIDIGFGDIITPEAEESGYPTLLDFPAPKLQVYPKETVIAEKLQAMVALGMANSRMKDFYDIWVISKTFPFEGGLLSRAIQLTFERRQTAVSNTIPIALTPEFGQNSDKLKQWQAFLKRNQLDVNGSDFTAIIRDLGHFLLPPLLAIADNPDFSKTWLPGGPWTPNQERE